MPTDMVANSKSVTILHRFYSYWSVWGVCCFTKSLSQGKWRWPSGGAGPVVILIQKQIKQHPLCGTQNINRAHHILWNVRRIVGVTL
jgi:hypothetical protein